MIAWQRIEANSRNDWDEWAARSGDTLVFQSWGWGDFKQKEGWTPLRLAARDTRGQIVAIAQVLSKRMPGGIQFAWVPGGPVELTVPASRTALYAGFTAAAKDALGRCYVRCSFMVPHDDQSAIELAHFLSRPLVKLNSGHSIVLDLGAADPDWVSTIDSKHRYYVKKSRKTGLTWRYGDSDDLLTSLAELSARMSHEKGLGAQGAELPSLLHMRDAAAPAVRVLVGYLDGEAVSACLALRFAESAFYASAATVGRGRDASAAYAMFAELRDRLRDEGVTRLDFGGVDLVHPDGRGVAHFKSGFGGKAVEYLGEWDWASAAWVRLLGNLALRIKKGRS